MEFSYIGSFYVGEDDIQNMVKMVKDGYDVQEVIDDWAAGLDDKDYYAVEFIEYDLKQVILNEIVE